MRSRADHRQDRSLARLARWLGIDRNPLRRGIDRVEAALRGHGLDVRETAVR